MTPFHLIVFYGEVIELIMNYFFPALNPIIFHPLADLSLLCMCYFSIYLHSGWVTKCPPPPRNLLDPGPSQSLGPWISTTKREEYFMNERYRFRFCPPRIKDYNLDAAYLLLSLITTLVASQIVAGWSSQAFYSIKFR